MKILITRFPYESQLSGEEWHTIKLAEKLRQRGHEIFFMGSCEILLKEMRQRGFFVKKVWGSKPPVTIGQLILFTITSPLIFLNLAHALFIFKRAKRIDVLYCLSFTEKLLLTPVAKLLGIKTIIWMEHARIGRWLTGNPWLPVYKLWSHFAKVIYVSRQSARAATFLPENLKHVIINGIDLKEFTPAGQNEKPSRSVFTGHRIPETAALIGTIARLSKDKGLDYFIRAAHEVLTQDKHVHFVVAGKGGEREKLNNLIIKLGRQENIHMLGELNRKQTIELYKLLDIVVLPSSLHDPFGLVAAEAMAMKKPVIVTDMCGIADELKREHDAIVIPSKNEHTLARAILRLLANPDIKDTIAANARRTAEQKFSEEKMIATYEKLLTIKT